MPSRSPAQARMMAAAAHDPAFAKKVGVPVSVAEDFNRADKGRGLLSKAMSNGNEARPVRQHSSKA